jgi:hypothetical protein
MTAAVALRDFMEPLLPGWKLQLGRWQDSSKQDRFAVIKPSGGPSAALVRRPQFAVLLIGAEGDGANLPAERADAVIEAMRASSGSIVFMQPSEPTYWPTHDGRPVSEFAVSAITN